MKLLVLIPLLVVGVIHLIPVIGVISTAKLYNLYGLSTLNDVNLEILLRHRAILFGLLGGFMILAACNKNWQALALFAGSVSTASFLYLSWSVGNYNTEISKVVWVDWVALAALIIAVFAFLKKPATSGD